MAPLPSLLSGGGGKSARDAGLEAGYRDGPGLKGNISRLRQTAIMRERITEIAACSTELAELMAGAAVAADLAALAAATDAAQAANPPRFVS